MSMIQYFVDCKGINIDRKIIIKPDDQHEINSIIFEPVPKGSVEYHILSISIIFTHELQNRKEAKDATIEVVKVFLDCLTFQYGTAIKNLRVNATDVKEEGIVATGNITISVTSTSEIIIKNDTEFKDILSNLHTDPVQKLRNYASFIQFKTVITVDDKIARFLLLYAILIEIFGHQKAIDEFIKIQEPSVNERETTRESYTFMETIYSWLRNQAQHMQTNTDVNKLIQDINPLLNQLEKLVLAAIKEHIE